MSEPTEREKMMSGELHNASDPELAAARIAARRATRAYSALDPGAAEEQRALLSGLFRCLGENAFVEAPFHCDYGWNISLGAGAYVNAFCVFLDCAPVTIGDRTLIGPGVHPCAVAHPVDPDERRRGLECARPIVLGTNVWIGAGVVVGPGVTIGDDSVVGAGSIVLHDVPARVLVAGNPARIIRRI